MAVQTLGGSTDPLRNFSCDLCEYVGPDIGSVKYHKKVKHGIKCFFCLFCSYVANSVTDLKLHKRRKHKDVKHESIRYPCDRCDFSAGTITYMNMHIKVKHEGFSFKCEEEGCNFQSKDKSNLRDHVRVKHKRLPKKFKCKIQKLDKETKRSRPCTFETGTRPHLLKHKTEVHEMSAQD